MSLPDLAALLWRQRDLLERLTYRLECEQLLLAAGRTRWLALATSEVETLLEEMKVLEMQRAAAADAACAELGLPVGSPLEDMAAAADPPWSGVLLEHRQELLSLTGELAALAEATKHLMATGLRAVESALVQIGLRSGTASQGYDAQGRTDVISGGGAAVVDRAL